MSVRPFSAAWAMAAITALPLCLHAQTQRLTAPWIVAVVDSVARRAVADGLAPALGVAIAMNGRIIHARSYGVADQTAAITTTDRTLWYLASTSKSLTGFGASLLAHEGQLQFADPITRLLPQARWHTTVTPDSLTLAHFLSHTHRVDDNAVVMSAAFTGQIPEAQWPALLAAAPKSASADLVYTNLGYNVAAMVIDAKRPEGWKRFLQQRVYAPAGMRETFAHISGIDARRIAKPHRLRADGRYVTTPFFKTDATMNAAGGHLATLHDLARWTLVQMDSGMIDGRRVFPKQAVVLGQTLIAPHTRESAKRFAYFDREGWGAGWDLGSYEGERMVSRFGSYDATRSHLSFLPARRIGVVVMSNGGTSAVTDVLAALAYDLEAGRADALTRAATRLQEVRDRHAALVRNAGASDSTRAARQQQPLGRTLNEYAGRYADASYGTIVFTVRDGQLFYEWGALYGPVEIFDAAKQQMRLEVAGSGAVVTFTFGERGPATAVSLQGATLRRLP